MATTAADRSSEVVPLPLLTAAPDRHVRFSREAYHRLVDVGLLDSNSRVELIDGEIFMMLPIGPPQGSLITRLGNYFIRNLSDTFDCRIQLPIVAGDHSEPEPDIAIVRRRQDFYRNEHPSPNDVVLLIEVAQSSLDFDLGIKLRLYAKSGIPEYWVVDVEHNCIRVHRNPRGKLYDDVTAHSSGTIAPLAVPDCRLNIGELFS